MKPKTEIEPLAAVAGHATWLLMFEIVSLDRAAPHGHCIKMERSHPTDRAALSPEDQALDDLWRTHFNEPLPMIGAGEIVQQILLRNGVTEDQIRRAINRRTL